MDDPCAAHSQLEKDKRVPEPRRPIDWLRAALPLVVALLISLFVVFAITKYQRQIESLKGYGYLGAFVIGFLGNATVILPAPSLALTTALGGVLNPILVGVAAGAGEALGEMTGYLAGVSGNAIIENRGRYQGVQAYMERHGAWVFFVLAAIPNPLFDLVGIAAGAVRFPVWTFLISTWAGKTLKAILFAGAGRQLLGDTYLHTPPWKTLT
jgi:uncharacterized membrane protein YdjX (TVP38/TMEM64 family)